MSATDTATETVTQSEILARTLARPGFLDRTWVPPVFLLATVGTVFLVGLEHALGFEVMMGRAEPSWSNPAVLLQAAIYTAALMGILGAHEMGHWLVARRLGVKTSLPVFIPMPLGIGTFGAVISMKELPPTRAALIRIGAAGPLAGGVVALALMAAAITTCPMIPLPELDPSAPAGLNLELGESLTTLILGNVLSLTVPQGMVPLATPFYFAAWTGFLLTSLNLLPVGQLDGGHVFYGLIGERANRFSRPFALAVMALAIPASLRGFSLTYFVWGLLLLTLVSWHPPVPRPEDALSWDAKLLAVACLVLFALTFMLSPMRIVG